MANTSYDMLWQEAMSELNEQLHIEDDTLALAPGEERPPPTPVTAAEAFQHYACLYIKYLQVFRKLESCYDSMVHPQKRLDVKVVLETVMCRMLETKHALVRWNPVNPDVAPTGSPLPPFPFPWEYVNLDDILVDLKLPPSTLEVPVPRFFLEDRAEEIKNRNKLVQGYMNLKLGVDKVFAEMEEDYDDAIVELTPEQAIEVIKRNERGRQGKQRALLVKEVRADERKQMLFDATMPSSIDKDPNTAASDIQKVFRGYRSRMLALKAREEELIFIGMRPGPEAPLDDLRAQSDVSRVKRKTTQAEHKEGYERALADLHGTVLQEEGAVIREKLTAERRAWFTEQLGKGVFPESLKPYYESLKAPDADAVPKEDTGKKGKKGKGKKEKKAKKAKGKKGKGKGKGDEEPQPILPPPLTGPTALTKAMGEAVSTYESMWLERDETENFAQKHDEDAARAVVRPTVEEEVRVQVDRMLEDQLANFKKQLAGGKGKKGKKGKKGRKGKKKGKKGKGKKGKALPGAKACGSMDVDHMLSVLIENKIVNNVRPRSVQQLVGGFNFLGSAYQASDTPAQRHPVYKTWVAQDPSMQQIRSNLTEYAVLRLGSPAARKASWKFCSENGMKPGKAILLYGPRGTGKTTLAEAVAHHTGAIFFNLSPSNLEGKFQEKGGAAKLLHMVFTVAKEAVMGPAVIYIDEVEKICASTGKKKTVSDGPARFKKDLPTYINSIKEEHSAVVIGCTSAPWAGEEKSLRQCFDRHLYVPFPKYSDLFHLWTNLLTESLKTVDFMLPESFDVSSLAHITCGYSAGSIVRAVRSTLTKRRLSRLAKRPLAETEFINALARNPRTFAEENEKFRVFTESITGLTAMRKKVAAALAGDDGKSKKKKGKKK